jgi:trimeric autotransporter adhesin
MVKSSISSVPFAISSRVADSLANGEYDPIFRQSVASGITSDDIVRWNGDITETEPSPPFNLELPNGKIYLGDGTNQAAEVTMSGDVTIDNAGATAIGASKVLTGNILDGTIVVGDLANAAVETTKIRDANVTTEKIATGAVTNTKLDKSNIPLSGFGAASADVALGSNKLTGVAEPTEAQEVAMTGDVTIDNAGVTAIGTDKVLTGNILDGTIVVGDLANAAVETAKIKDGNVTTEKIAADAVTTDKIADSPILAGIPQAPTAGSTTNTDQIATTAFVQSVSGGKVADQIADGTTTIAPSQNAVFDALALKLALAGGTMSGDIAMGGNNLSGAGTVSATTFLGDLNGTINSITTATTQPSSDASTRVATTAFVAVGYRGRGTVVSDVSNLAVGYEALVSITDSGGYPADWDTDETEAIDNTAIGYMTLNLTTDGTANTAVGKEALSVNTQGDDNTAIGAVAMVRNQTGDRNTAVGRNALFSNLSGNENTAIGGTSLFSNTTGGQNTAVGRNALYSNTSNDNTAVGEGALYSSTVEGNTAVGYRAGASVNTVSGNTTGTYNTYLGYRATTTINNLTNATAIGNGAQVNASNKIRLGNATVSVIEGQVAFSNASDARLKRDIRASKYGLHTIMQLRPVDYILINNNLRQVGFIAQEVQQIVPEVVTGKEGAIEKGETLGITYASFTPILAKAIQEQQVLIRKQELMNKELEAQVAYLKEQYDSHQAQIDALSALLREVMAERN